jgi:signal transduction protein with GAF and PtsI domain
MSTAPLKQKIEPLQALEQENQTLHSYLEMVKELYWAGQTIASADNLLYELNQLLYKVMGVMEAKDGSICRLDEEANELIFMLVHGDLGRQLPDYRLKADTGIAGWVVSNQKPIIVNDPRQDKRFSRIVDTEFGFFTKSIISAPIMRRGNLKGVIQLLNKRGNEFNEDDIALLLILGHVSAIVFEEMGPPPSVQDTGEDNGLMPAL